MVRKKGRTNEIIQGLERQLNKALKQKDDRTVCDSYVELGDEYRRIGDLQEALSHYGKGVQLAEKFESHENCAFAHRAIAEILVDPNIQENAKALQHAEKYLEAAHSCGKIHVIQLAYHVLGWLHLQIYVNSGAKQEALLEKAKMWCEKSLAYLSKHAADIDCDKEAVRIGQDSRSRKARLQQVLSQICDKMRLQKQALHYHNGAMAYAARTGDHDLQYRCLLSKLDFFGDQRLKTAIELVHVATSLNHQASSEARFILAQEKLRVRDFVGAKWDLISMLASKDHEKLDVDEQKSFYEILIAVYKTVERLRMLSTFSGHIQMKINEKIADSLYECGFSDVALVFYKQMLLHADTTNDKIKALVSIAETAKEQSRYNEALSCYLEVESLESSLDLNDFKKGDTAICIASVAASAEFLSSEKVFEFFRKAENIAVRSCQKKTLYEVMLEYVERNNLSKELYADIEKKVKNLCDDADIDSLSGSEEGADTDFVDAWDELSDTQILARCHEEANHQSMEERIRLEKDKKINLYGETRMHEAARGNDTEYLNMLIKMGYNVNARDEGGWTPLHEAVGALKFENVQLLAQNGANLNMQSNEGTLSADGERTDSGGLTPLMEACDRGATAIVSLLLNLGANVAVKNRDEWTAFDFFRNAIKVGMVEEEDMTEAKHLLLIMEKKLKEVGITVCDEPPPKKLKLAKPKSFSLNNTQQKALDPNLADLHDYQKVMKIVGRGATHDRMNFSRDGLNLNDGIFDEDERDLKSSRKQLEPSLDDLLIGINDVEGSSSRRPVQPTISHSCLFSSSSRLRSSHTENEASDFSQRSLSIGNSGLPSTSGCGALCTPFCNPELTFKRRKKKDRLHTENKKDFLDDSSDEPLGPSYLDAQGRKDTDIVGDCRPPFSDYSSSTTSVTRKEERAHLSQNVECAVPLKQATEMISNAAQNQLFVKIVFKKDDGSRFKTKGMPFPSSCTIGSVRKRCEDELKGDIEYTSMTICYDDCELSDDTPMELVLTNGNKVLECTLNGWSKPSASQIYEKKAKRIMLNVSRALTESTNGCLDLRDMNVGQDDAVCAAIETLEMNLSELYLDGNTLSHSFIKSLAQILRQLKIFSASCCLLNSRSFRQLIADRSMCNNMKEMNLSFNNLNEIGSDLVGTFVSLCPYLVQLELASCNMSQSMADGLIQQLKKIISLEVLDLSFNLAINSQHASEIIEMCNSLKHLNLSSTGVTELAKMSEQERKLETLKLSLNDLCNPKDVVHWSLKFCPCIVLLDLSATTVDSSIIELCLKLKADKVPTVTILLADCNQLETESEITVNILKAILTATSTVRFQFSKKFRCEVEDLLPDSYKFCLK